MDFVKGYFVVVNPNATLTIDSVSSLRHICTKDHLNVSLFVNTKLLCILHIDRVLAREWSLSHIRSRKQIRM